MEKLQTIKDVSKNLGISNRMLRYYEQIGLIQSQRIENYAYRVYDASTVSRIRKILILRKLRISIKDISRILCSNEAAGVIEVFERNVNEIDEEVTALATIRSILQNFIGELQEKSGIPLLHDWLQDSPTVVFFDMLPPSAKNKLQEEKNMSDLHKASEDLSKLRTNDVRIIYLPPSAVASAHTYGENAEEDTDIIMGDFVESAELFMINPGLRFYGFNHPNVEGNKFIAHGYEVMVTIPDYYDVPAPLTKKHFPGGFYAAFTSDPDNWAPLYDWIINNENFEYDAREPSANLDGAPPQKGYKWACSGYGRLEEHFNSYNVYGLDKKHCLTHIDLLMPIKEKRVL